MKLILRAAIAAASLASIGSANAESDASPNGKEVDETPAFYVQAPDRQEPAVVWAQAGDRVWVHPRASSPHERAEAWV